LILFVLPKALLGRICPGLEGIEGATNKDIAGEMIKAIEKNFN
jgi:hypothetical protein